MPMFMILSTLTDEGAKTLKTKPQRVREVNAELEKMGVKVLQQYAVLGGYDFLNIVEAPDEKTVAAAMVELASRGTIKTYTFPIIPLEEFLEKLG
jgi:uncharacterized protein with GYD domain